MKHLVQSVFVVALVTVTQCGTGSYLNALKSSDNQEEQQQKPQEDQAVTEKTAEKDTFRDALEDASKETVKDKEAEQDVRWTQAESKPGVANLGDATIPVIETEMREVNSETKSTVEGEQFRAPEGDINRMVYPESSSRVDLTEDLKMEIKGALKHTLVGLPFIGKYLNKDERYVGIVLDLIKEELHKENKVLVEGRPVHTYKEQPYILGVEVLSYQDGTPMADETHRVNVRTLVMHHLYKVSKDRVTQSRFVNNPYFREKLPQQLATMRSNLGNVRETVSKKAVSLWEMLLASKDSAVATYHALRKYNQDQHSISTGLRATVDPVLQELRKLRRERSELLDNRYWALYDYRQHLADIDFTDVRSKEREIQFKIDELSDLIATWEKKDGAAYHPRLSLLRQRLIALRKKAASYAGSGGRSMAAPAYAP